MVPTFRVNKTIGFINLLFAGMVLCTSNAFSLPPGSVAFYPVPLEQADQSALNTADNVILTTKQLLGDSAPFEALITEQDLEIKGISQSALIRQTLDSIEQIQLSNGVYDASLTEKYFTLGNIYQNRGEHEKAISSYMTGLQNSRVHSGLKDLNQEVILEKLIESHLALNQLGIAHELEKTRLDLYLKNFNQDDNGKVPGFIKWANWNVNLFLKRNSAPLDFRMEADNAIDERNLNSLLIEAQEYYINTLNILQRNETLDTQDVLTIVDIEKKLAAISYIINQKADNNVENIFTPIAGNQHYGGKRPMSERVNSANFFYGSSALKRAIAYTYNRPNPEYQDIAAQMMELGDWYLLFDRRQAALEVYKNAYEVLTAASLSKQQIEQIMSFGMPVIEPNKKLIFEFNNDQEREFHGYIDVEFNLSKFGIATRPEIIGISHNNGKNIQKELIRTIRKAKFRPAFVEGTPENHDSVRLRYYYSYSNNWLADNN